MNIKFKKIILISAIIFPQIIFAGGIEITQPKQSLLASIYCSTLGSWFHDNSCNEKIIPENITPITLKPITVSTSTIIQNIYKTFPVSYINQPIITEKFITEPFDTSNFVTKDFLIRQVDAIANSTGRAITNSIASISDVDSGSGISLSDVISYISSSSSIPHISGSSYGDIIYWNGSAWDKMATSSLGITSGISSQWTTLSSNIYFNTGNIGIGTTSPLSKLSVTGDIYSTGTTTSNGFVLNTSGTFKIGNDVFIDSNGNINATVLPLQDTAAALSAIVPQSGEIVYETDTGYAKIGNGITSVGSLSAFNNNTSAWSLNGTSTYYTAGNVGIGSTTPSAKLTVVGGNIAHTASGTPLLASNFALSITPSDVYISGKYAYIAGHGFGNHAMNIVDISNPTNPSLISTFDMTAPDGISVSGKYAYVADGTSGLKIIDISNPTTPLLIGTYNTSGTATKVYISGKYAYVADDSSGLQIIDISNPASPSLVGTYNTGSAVGAVYVSGKYAYIGDDAPTLKIIDISNSTSPTLVGTYSAGGTVKGIQVSGKYAYITDDTVGFSIIKISNTTSPTLVSTYNTSGAVGKSYISGKYAYFGDSSSSLVILNISSSTVPSLVGTYDGLGLLNSIQTSGKYAYAVSAFSPDALFTVDINGLETPAITTGSIDVGSLNVSENINTAGDIYINGGINAGISGIFSRGTISAYVASSTQTNPVVANFMGGNVGIGSTSPTAKLSITQSANTNVGGIWLSATDGDYRAMYMDTSGILNFNGGNTGTLNTATLNAAGAWTNASDRAYKENIVDLNTKYTLADIMKIEPRYYTMKGSGQPQIGFIAQELKPIIPEVVEGTDGSMGISYGNLAALLVQGIKELNTKMNSILSWFDNDKLKIQNDICVDNVCITKDQFKNMILNAGGSIVQQQIIQTPQTNQITVSTTTEPIVSTSTLTVPDTTPAPIITEPVAPVVTTPVEPPPASVEAPAAPAEVAPTP